MESDPIVDSPAQRRRSEKPYDSQDDSGDELLADYADTVPLSHPYNPANTKQASRYFNQAPPRVTQPTQILDTPVANRADPNAVVQVPASSPVAHTQLPSASPSPAKAFTKSTTAPAGHTARPTLIATITEGSFDDDPPAASSSEDELATSRSDIPQSLFFSKTKSNNASAAPPVKKFSMAQFAYTGPPQKRSADDMANAYSSSSKRPRLMPRQTGPSRAQPVEDMTLDDITDFLMKQKVKRMNIVYPNKSISLLLKALREKKGNVDDAMSYVCELEESEHAQRGEEMIDLTVEEDTSPPKPANPSGNRLTKAPKALRLKPSGNQVSKVSTKSIHEKWSTTQHIQISDDDEPSPDPSPVKRRRRLVKGRRPASPSSSPTAAPQKSVPAPRQKKTLTIDSDGESDAQVSDEEVDEEAAQENAKSLLAYINQCSAQELVDLSEKTLVQCEAILVRRPFKSLDAIRRVDMSPPPLTKSGQPRKNHRTTGDKVLDTAESMWAAYATVDQLVAQCKELGQPIFADMKKLGFHTSGAKVTGELTLVNLDDVRNDSGIGTPSSSTDAEDEDDVRGSNVRLLQKPAMMSSHLVLKDYQVVGLNWLNILWKRRISGILADDMGLGKTCQVIAFLSHLYETGNKGLHLIVVPNSTLENWLREFETFSPKLKVVPYYGSKDEKPKIRDEIMGKRNEIHVVVTSYDQATRNDDDNRFLRRLNPTVCVFDEGHQLRNSKNQRYKQLMRIPAEFRLLLSGTPIQNNLKELVSILAFISPAMFQGHEENLSYIFRTKPKTSEDTHSSLLSSQRIDRARMMMAPFILRRKKQQVLGSSLPPKTVRVEYCDMVPEQKAKYDALLETQARILLEREAGIVAESQQNSNITVDLRLAAVHPMLAARDFYDDLTIGEMAKDWEKTYPKHKKGRMARLYDLEGMKDVGIATEAEKYLDAWEKYLVPDDHWYMSGKIAKMIELVEKWSQQGDRCLIFSQWTRTMDIMERVLSMESIKYHRMDGGTPTDIRQGLIDNFYKDESIKVFMLSTKTGGTGINLTCANKVLIFDEQYNPQEDIQAENRAHRVGQTRPVEVVRLITKGTIEERIHALGVSKLAMDERVAGAPTDADDNGKAAQKMEKEATRKIEEDMLKEFKAKAGGDLKDAFKGMLEDAGIDVVE